jgi:hypothetical protein
VNNQGGRLEEVEADLKDFEDEVKATTYQLKNAEPILRRIPVMELKIERDCISPIQCLLECFAEEDFMAGVLEQFYEQIVGRSQVITDQMPLTPLLGLSNHPRKIKTSAKMVLKRQEIAHTRQADHDEWAKIDKVKNERIREKKEKHI